MRISVPGNSGRVCSRRGAGGFTLIELLVVIAVIAISIGVVSLALRDGRAAKLDEEGARLAALLDIARAEARVAGVTVRWIPAAGTEVDASGFHFVGLPASQPMPTQWLDPQTRAEVVGGTAVLLGPEAILPPQRIVLELAGHRLELASDGLGPFAVASAGPSVQ
jgi:general secretion pathway protein H